MYRRTAAGVEFLLLHPGGPFWAKKDDGAWSIPKGLYVSGEDPLEAAKREFAEETGFAPVGAFVPLGEFRQPSGKIIAVWAVEGDLNVARLHSNAFSMEWPAHSGKLRAFLEADKGEWFSPADALRKITRGQRAILLSLLDRLGLSGTAEPIEP
jgi:predicted NUDIX family NTP pyrophosphohydrolase